jgi:hypothetical protein
VYDVRDVVVLMRDAAMSSTYKPALLKSLARLAALDPAARSIPLATIGHQFVRLYWNQTVVYHLRQAPTIGKEPTVVRDIRRAAESEKVRSLNDVTDRTRTALDRRMASALPVNVLDAFHTSKPSHMPLLYTWHRGDSAVELPEAAASFLATNAATLEMIANYAWAAKLERFNMLAPLIIEKVRLDGARRTSLVRYVKILRETDGDRCFYCATPLDAAPEVDHVLPWSFLLENPSWDLVLACRACNGAKSDRLPTLPFVEKLIATNAGRARFELSRFHISPLVTGETIRRYYDAAIANEWPRDWAPPNAS